MDTRIAELDARIAEHCKQAMRYDEELFNLGVELGRLLQQDNIATHRPSAFIDFENKNDAYEKKAVQIKRAEKAIAFLIRNAIAEQIENYSPFCFDSNAGSYSCEKFEDDVVEKFFVQVDHTTQQEHGGSFEAHYIFRGKVAEILNRYGISENAKSGVDNSSGDEEETIYNADDVDKIFSVSLRLSGHHTDLDEAQLTALADELEKVHVEVFFVTKNPR